MAIDVKTMEMLRKEPEIDLDLGWIEMAKSWGWKATPGKRGLTLDDISEGELGVIPETTRNYTGRPRGVVPRPGAPRVGTPYSDRADTWADSLMLLYEEALARQWSSATDIPWETLEPLPDDLELAMCQLSTFLTEVEFVAGDIPGRWLPSISPEFFEVQLFLGTQIMDEGRHLDVFRKRALANGGGLMEGLGFAAVGSVGSSDFAEASTFLHIIGEGFVQSMFRMGEYISQNEAEKRIFRRSAEDESRHVAFGVMHLKHLIATQPERREEIHHYLDKGESGLLNSQAGVTFNASTMESLAILLGGGVDKFDEGVKLLISIRQRQVKEYVHRLQVCGFADRLERMHPSIAAFVN